MTSTPTAKPAGPVLERVAAVSILLLVNIAYFSHHYLGDFIFPWDFSGGYHAMAYAIYADGGLFAPELWSPYGNCGFPTHAAVQNSAFYPPLELLGWLGVPYTLSVAVWIQCLHVLVGSIGVYFLLRLNDIGVTAAITGGIVFQLSSGFFSNAQHVDIIRAYSLMPWVFIAISQRFLVSPRRGALAAWILFAFVSGSYPGIVVATVYGALVYVAREAAGIMEWRNRRSYLAVLIAVGLIAVMLSCIKFLPLLAMQEELFHHARVEGVYPEHFLTILFRFDVAEIPYNLTMRSYYLPVTALILIGLTTKVTRPWRLGLLLTLMSVAFIAHDTWIRSMLLGLPGLMISRMHLSDFRMLFHLGLILMACASLQSLMDEPPSKVQLAVRGVALALAMWLVANFASADLYTPESLESELVMFACSLGILLFATPFLPSSTKRIQRWIAVGGIWFATGFGAFTYAMHAPRTWRSAGYEERFAGKIYGEKLDTLMGGGERRKQWDHRPKRFDRANQFASNRGYYKQEFSMSGLDSGDRLNRNIGLRKELSRRKPRSALHAFLMDRSRTILVSELEPESVKRQIARADDALDSRGSDQNLASMLSFGLSGSRYRVASDGTRWLVENELYFPGWRSRVCREEQCDEGPLAEEAVGWLRAWKLPAGEYELEIYYEPPYWFSARALFWSAVAMSVFLLARAKRFEFQSPRRRGQPAG